MNPVSGKRMIKILEDRGWQRVRTSGSHHSFKHPGFRKLITVPVHGNQDLASGTQRKIMRDAGLKDEDL